MLKKLYSMQKTIVNLEEKEPRFGPEITESDGKWYESDAEDSPLYQALLLEQQKIVEEEEEEKEKFVTVDNNNNSNNNAKNTMNKKTNVVLALALMKIPLGFRSCRKYFNE